MTDKSNVVKNSASIAKEVEQLDEDSSYDSDTEIVSSPHQNVSRNVSETLALELFEDFNSTSYRQYQTYLEFALKLGYSERLVQSALNRLGNPTNNELLAELIKLGAQPGSNACDFGADIKSSEIGDECVTSEQDVLRPIVIDGSNVAMGHGNKEVFSCRGIALCVDWFRQRGHKDITVFVPKWRKESARPDNPIKDQEILNELEKERILVYTPSRSLTNGKRMVCYDDRYILKLAVDNDGVVVSNDNYRDLLQESNEFKKVVEERILMYSFVNDRFMPPDDPLGKLGPTLDNFLKFQPKKSDQQICPYGAKKKCTYGNKCKFFHPERGSQPHKSVTEKLSDFANYHLQARNSDAIKKQVQGKSLSVPLNNNNITNIPASSSGENFHRKQTLCRTTSNVLNSMPSQQQQQLQSQQHLVPPNLQLGQHHPHQYLRPGQQALSASTSPTNNMMPHLHQQQQQQQFPKSHSIENLPREMYQPVNYSNSNLWNQGQQPDPSNQHGSQLDSQDMSLNLNLHKKLQRQLSLLNPFDPRLYPMQRYHNLQSHMGQGNPNPEHFQLSSPPAHKPLSTSHSLTGGASQGQNPTHPIYEHQNVMRIASAPNSSNNWTNNSANNHNHLPSSSASEPHINWPIADQRRRLHYHLCNIFPKKDVEQAMSMFPDEANPQKICSAILNIQSLRQ